MTVNRKAAGLLMLAAGIILVIAGVQIAGAFGEREADCATFVYVILGATGLWKGFVMIHWPEAADGGGDERREG